MSTSKRRLVNINQRNLKEAQCYEEQDPTTSYSNDDFIAGLQMNTAPLHTEVDHQGKSVLMGNDI